MNFARRAPCPELQPLVKFYWLLEQHDPDPAADEVIVPDGCMELIFHFGAPWASVEQGRVGTAHPRAMVGGQITRSITIRPTGPLGMLGVRFRPFGARPLLKLAMDELTGRTLDAAALLGPVASDTVEQLALADGNAMRFRIVESLLLHLLRDDGTAAADPLACASVAALAATRGTLSVAQLAAQLHVSPRHLNRALHRHVGLGAKPLARIMRLQFAIAILRRGEAASLTDAACAAGYFDQAHFSRDVRAFCGLSPGAFIRQPHKLAESFG